MLCVALVVTALALQASPACAQDAACSRLIITERKTGKKLQILVVERDDEGEAKPAPVGKKKSVKPVKSSSRRVFVGRETTNVPKEFYENIQFKSDEEIELTLNPATIPANMPGQGAPAGDPANAYVKRAMEEPESWVTLEGFRCRAIAAARWTVLKSLIAEKFPGRRVVISSTVDGRHVSASHPDGRAIDFCVLPLTDDESAVLEELCRQAGFTPYNEYIYDSPYKTGDHMHVSL